MINIDFSGTSDFISEEEVNEMKDKAYEAFDLLYEKNGPGAEYTGFVELPRDYDKEEFQRIKLATERIRNQSEALVVIGIGGSYLGTRAMAELFYGKMYNELRKCPIKFYFTGNSLSSRSLSYVMDAVKHKGFSVNVISKSGTTLETSVAFRIFRNILVNRYGEKEANKRIYCTTDKSKGILKEEADRNGWETFTVPDNIGGRYSVLSAVGLLPLEAAGIDTEKLLAGAREIMPVLSKRDISENPALQYALVRNILYKKGKEIEILGAFESAFTLFTEWWKQLFAESEGKDGKGIFPASCIFSTDLHSIGQYIQDGTPDHFETIVDFGMEPNQIKVPVCENFGDGLEYLEGVGLDEINKAARLGSRKAHIHGGTPYISIELDGRNETSMGSLFYFFEIAAGLSAYILGVNPFNQPGVEEYKQNMFALLGKKGYDI